MAVSNKTVTEILSKMRKHVTEEQLDHILKDLANTPGNGSYRESIRKLQLELATERMLRKGSLKVIKDANERTLRKDK